VKVLDKSSKTTIEENQRLVISVDELESRLQTLEAKIALTEASMTNDVSLCRTSPLVYVCPFLQLTIYICSEVAWTEIRAFITFSLKILSVHIIV
jgi:uncharacterized small protein (DUF1192 family)